MIPTASRHRGKRKWAEANVGLPLLDYFENALRRGLTQIQMADELRVSRPTVCLWMKELGYRSYFVYKRRRRNAA